MNVDYIVVQAGGKGSRLGYLTKNKPKAIVPVNNLPMLFHLFRKFPDKAFVIITDYHKDVLREYLKCFANVKYVIAEAEGSGTCSGVKKAISYIPDAKPFMLIWSDLILPESFRMPDVSADYVGLSQTFPCRWSYKDDKFTEESSETFGVAGMFIFQDKSALREVPTEGELVRWMSNHNMTFEVLGLAGTKEFGILSEYEKLDIEKCRPFNRITEKNGKVIKEGIDEQGKKLAMREVAWYRYAKEHEYKSIPEIFNYHPLEMERIHGKNIYEYADLTMDEKRKILSKLVCALDHLHSIGQEPTDYFSINDAYIKKTFTRLQRIQSLVPFANERFITVNGKKCRNVFFYQKELEQRIEEYRCEKFCFIHGDCTFSNMLLKNDEEPVFIDPRGYFGYTELFGDPAYDWAKLYYSVIGDYDQFNLKRFRLTIEENGVTLNIESNGFRDLEEDFFALVNTDSRKIKLIHAIIWLSLTTYAWQDYDSICGAFYNGLFYLEEIL